MGERKKEKKKKRKTEFKEIYIKATEFTRV